MINLPKEMPKLEQQIFCNNENQIHYTSVPPIPENLLYENNKNKIAAWVLHESMVPSLKLDIAVPHEDILAEALINRDRFVKHRGHTSPGWTSMAIHGTAVEDTQPREHYIKEGKYTEDTCPEYHWTELADSCPVTKAWLESLNFQLFHRVRFMNIDPGGWISSHADTDTRGLQAWNVSINEPVGHTFCMDGFGYVPWQAGEVRGIDIGLTHTIVNTGPEPRIHIIIHGHHSHEFNELMIRSYGILYNDVKN